MILTCDIKALCEAQRLDMIELTNYGPKIDVSGVPTKVDASMLLQQAQRRQAADDLINGAE